MANVELKKDFKDGQFLYGDDLNNNFKVIEAGINANEKNLQDVIDQAQEDLKDELEEITGERGWDWNDNSGERVTFYKGDTNQVNEKPISNGQLLYDITTGETALDTGGKRVTTGAGNVLAVSDEEPTNPGTKVWIKPNELQKVDSTEVIDSLEGNETNLAPSVRAVKGSFMQILSENYNVDNIKTSGIYGIFNAKGTLPAGLDINDNNIFLHCFMWYADYGRQIIYDVRTLKTYMRILNNGIWHEWKSENEEPQEDIITGGSAAKCGYKIDGKAVYVKCIDLGQLPNAGSKSVSTGLKGRLVNIIKFEGFAYDNSGSCLSLPFVSSLGVDYNVQVILLDGGATIDVSSTQNYSPFFGILYIYYTNK